MRYTHTQISLFIGIEIAYLLSAVACKNDIGIKVQDKLSICWQAYSYRGPSGNRKPQKHFAQHCSAEHYL